MTHAIRRIGAGLALCAGCIAGFAHAAPPAPAERCEAAVAETVKRMRGRDAQEIQFVGEKRVVLPAKGEDVDVKGEGRYAGAKGGAGTGFAYSCIFNSQTGATSGVLFRETGGPRSSGAAADSGPPLDLSHFSPENCESAAAAALKTKYPRVGRIVFDGEGRELRAAPNAVATLDGQGAVERAAGMNRVPFKYRCEFDTRNGKVLRAQTSE